MGVTPTDHSSAALPVKPARCEALSRAANRHAKLDERHAGLLKPEMTVTKSFITRGQRVPIRCERAGSAPKDRLSPDAPCSPARAAPDREEREGETTTMLLADPFDALLNLQQALDSFRASDWLLSSPSGTGPYPPLNVFRKGDDFLVIIELPGIKKSELEIQAKDNTIRIAGTKSVSYPEKVSLHRRERLGGRFDRAVTLPVEIDADRVKAEYHDGILALFLPRSERDKPRTIKIS
jgi:HSP20 family protein